MEDFGQEIIHWLLEEQREAQKFAAKCLKY